MGAPRDIWNRYETLDSKRDTEGVASLFAIDCVYVEPGGPHEGREAIRAIAEMTHTAFPDMKIEASLVLEHDDTVMAEWTFRGTHTGPLRLPDGSEVPPTGNAVDFPGVSVIRLRDGKIATTHEYWDNMRPMSQVGLMPGT